MKGLDLLLRWALLFFAISSALADDCEYCSRTEVGGFMLSPPKKDRKHSHSSYRLQAGCVLLNPNLVKQVPAIRPKYNFPSANIANARLCGTEWRLFAMGSAQLPVGWLWLEIPARISARRIRRS